MAPEKDCKDMQSYPKNQIFTASQGHFFDFFSKSAEMQKIGLMERNRAGFQNRDYPAVTLFLQIPPFDTDRMQPLARRMPPVLTVPTAFFLLCS